MSVSLYKLVEVKGKDGKWRLVKWHPDSSDTSQCWIWYGLSFRDYFIHNYDIRHPEPDDISEDTKRILEEEPNNPSYFFMGYNELCDIAHTTFERVWGTLVNAIMYHCGESLSGINGVMRPGIVHRIDRDTTGSVIICKNESN